MDKETVYLINLYCDALLPGFSQDNWTNAARIYSQLSAHVDLDTYSLLGSLMAEMYARPSTKLVADVRKKAIKGLRKG